MHFIRLLFAIVVIGTQANAEDILDPLPQAVSLPTSIVDLIKKKLHVKGIHEIHSIAYRLEYPEYEYFGASLGLPSSGFEAVTHQEFIFRKDYRDKDWSNATIFKIDTSLYSVFGKQLRNFEASLKPYPIQHEPGAGANP